MSDRAMQVVRLLEQLRASTNAQESEQARIPQDVVMQGSPDSARPPKRPWEDISEDDPSSMSDPNGFDDVRCFFHLLLVCSDIHVVIGPTAARPTTAATAIPRL